jgi:mono/diheme cytochrome c family protein
MGKKAMTLRVAAGLVLLLGAPAFADSAAPSPPPNSSQRAGMFSQQSGEEIYKGICQGCHMPDAKGATGAGAYPALARDANLETAGYPIGVVVKGQKAMPAFADYFTDEQIANVINYVRTHFGNKYRDKVRPDDVKAMR